MAPKPQRWAKVEEIFHQALEKSLEERAGWVDRACEGDADLRAEVTSLLESDSVAREGFLGAKVQQAVLDLHDEETSARTMAGRRIGPYRLIREIGQGGMGAVYLAVRDDSQYESQVAIKLVRPGLDTDFIVRRFRRERQILARLEHPNITRLLDGGTTDDGIPWLVMEYIDGLWITRYAAQHKLSIVDRIRLCLPVCAAVEFAHRHFIVHRDLKPGNILIDRDGSPKLLDFGISKLLRSEQPDAAHTQGVALMTPDYASPEQIVGDPITIASDVYSLGAVIYELLTGVLPHRIEQCTPLALERAICLDPTAPPRAVVKDRALARHLKGDLDNIVLRAMQKEPERRYASVEHLAADLRRYLEHRPVVARPDSLLYRTGKFLRRNRVVVSLTTLATCSVVGGAAVAEQQAHIARQRFEDVRKLATTFVVDVEDAARDLPGSLRVRQLIARTGLNYLNELARSSARDWALKQELAAAYLRVGQVQNGSSSSNLGDPAAALASFSNAGKLLDEVLQHAPSDRNAGLDRMTVFTEIGNLERQRGNYAAATAAVEAGLRIGAPLLAADPKDLAAAEQAGGLRLDLARLRQQAGDLDSAEHEAAAGFQLLQPVAAAKPQDRSAQLNLAESHARLGAVEAGLGQRDAALASYRNQATVLEALCRAWPHDTMARHELMLAYGHQGDTLGNHEYDNAGDLPGAFQAYSRAVELAQSLYEADTADARALSDYGIALLRLAVVTPARGPARLATLERAHELLGRATSVNPQSRITASHKAWAEYELGALFLAAGDRNSGVHYYQMAITTAEKTLAASSNDAITEGRLVTAVRGLAEYQARIGARAEALTTLNKALRLAQTVDSTAPASAVALRADAARAWQAAGSVYSILGTAADRDAARRSYQRALDQWRTLETRKGFRPPDRREMEAAEQALEALGAKRTEALR